MPAKPCQESGCTRPKQSPFHRCYWHRLLTLPIDEQIGLAVVREREAREKPGFVERARIPQKDWPAGKRWCSGCQWFIPVFYAQGSRCKACASKASYSSHLKSEYGISYSDYQAMFDYQGGRCYICRRLPAKRRLAVDHDHKTGEVRGLLCADNDRGCNHAILGNITSIEMAERIVEYLRNPPFKAAQRGESAPANLDSARPIVQVKPVTETKVRGSAPAPAAADSPWNDGVVVGTLDLMRAWGAGEGLNAAGQRVPRGSEDDVTAGEAQNPPPAAPERPQERRAVADAQWDALTL